MPNYCRTCKKRAAGDESGASSDPSDHGDEKDDAAELPDLDLDDWEEHDA